MILGSFVLLVAIAISAIAAYYSVVGLTAIFSAAFWPIVIMGSTLEIAKITVTVWLHQNFSRARFLMKAYLVTAVIVLMFITSMGIFGALSKAHIEQSVSVGDAGSQVAEYDRQIAGQQRIIQDAETVIAQLDSVVETLTTAQRIRGADGALAVRNAQKAERAELTAAISEANAKILEIETIRQPLVRTQLELEAEVGPLRYIAALIYGDNPDRDVLEASVRWVIILLVFVFDPLAIMMVLAAVESFSWAQQGRKFADQNDVDNLELVAEHVEDHVVAATTELSERMLALERHNAELRSAIEVAIKAKPSEESPEKKAKNNSWVAPSSVAFSATVPSVTQAATEPESVETVTVEVVDDIMPDSVEEAAVEATSSTLAYTPLVDDYVDVNGKVYNARALTHLYPELRASTGPAATKNYIHFGTSFPTIAQRNDVFLRIDYKPSKLFTFNGQTWNETSKDDNAEYEYDAAYIENLITWISKGEYDSSLLSETERAQIERVLTNDKTLGI